MVIDRRFRLGRRIAAQAALGRVLHGLDVNGAERLVHLPGRLDVLPIDCSVDLGRRDRGQLREVEPSR
jgi:hypothetical protein